MDGFHSQEKASSSSSHAGSVHLILSDRAVALFLWPGSHLSHFSTAAEAGTLSAVCLPAQFSALHQHAVNSSLPATCGITYSPYPHYADEETEAQTGDTR